MAAQVIISIFNYMSFGVHCHLLVRYQAYIVNVFFIKYL